jgi:hypothetical protein
LWFLDTEFRDQGDHDVQRLVEDSIDTLTTKVGQLKALVAQRMASIVGGLDAAKLCVECPRCRQACGVSEVGPHVRPAATGT